MKSAEPGDIIKFRVDLAGGFADDRTEFTGIGVVLDYEYEPNFFMFAVLTGTAPYPPDNELPFPHGIFSSSSDVDTYTIIEGFGNE